MTVYKVDIMVNTVLAIGFMSLSRWVYHYFLIELESEKKEVTDDNELATAK